MKRELTCFALAVFSTASLLAQTTPPTSATTKPDVVVLSPFEVNVDTDVGYVGQNTLAGSRMRTNLKDIAAAISPMTAEFLQDIAATNIIDAMEYGMNARIETDDGRAAGPVNDGYNNSTRAVRIRGLPGGSRTVNYFRRLGEVDIFNADRLDLSRGPNSILFGFGSPAGLVNAGTKQARLDRRSFVGEFRIDSWGGHRSTFDASIPVIKNKLGFRAVVLHGEEESWRAAGFNDQDRLYLTGKWRIDPKTTLTADFETGRMFRFVPRPLYGVDISSPWFAANEPSFRNFDLSLPSSAPAGLPGKPFRDSGATQVNGVQEIGGNYVIVSDRFPSVQNFQNFTRSERPARVVADFVMGRANPKAALEADLWNGLWDNKSIGVNLQRELWRGLNLEIAANQQTLKTALENVSWEMQGIQGDPNLYLPNGQLKPVENRYYFEYRRSRNPNSEKMRQGRATLSYEHDFGDFARLRIAGLGEWNKYERRGLSQEEHWVAGPDATSPGAFHPTPENGANRVYQRHYINDLSALSDPNFRIPKPYDLSGGLQFQDPATGAVRTIYSRWDNSTANLNYYDEDMASGMIASQLYLLKNRLVLTGGVRSDTQKRYQTRGVRDPAAEALLSGSGSFIPVEPNGILQSKSSGDTYTAGGVYHFRPWLTGFYNRSSSVNVPGNQRIFASDPSLLEPSASAPSRHGQTQDYGLKVSLLRDQLFVTATSFNTSATNDTGFSGFQVPGQARPIWQALRDSGLLTGEELALATGHADLNVNGYTFDSRSKGYELEIVGQIRPRWSVSLNFSKTESIRTNVAPDARAYINYWRPYWLKFKDVQVPQSTTTPGTEYRPYEDFRTPAQIAATGDFTINTDTVNERLVDMENFFFDNPHAFEGTRYIGDNKYNVNVRTRYDFREGRLKGLSIGGGMRTRFGRVAGAKVDYEFTSGSSYTDAYNGRVIKNVQLVNAVDQKLFDMQIAYSRPVTFANRKYTWRVQLNVNNLLDEDEFIINNLKDVTLEPTAYRYQDPRQFILTNSLSF